MSLPPAARIGLLTVWMAAGVTLPAPAGEPLTAGPATVLVRVIGNVTAAAGMDDRVWRPSIELEHVPIGAGSGFVFSPGGYILTNSHVIRGGRARVRLEGRLLTVTITVQRVQVQLAGPDGGQQVVDASVIVDDPSLDLAVLHVGVPDLPFLPIGDSSIVSRNDPVSAWGYPFGDDAVLDTPEGTEPGRPRGTNVSVTATSGTITALLPDAPPDAEVAVTALQTSAPLNPGNSGGPLVDGDGYVVGVVRAKRRDAEGIGYAIPAEVVKDFLERNGLDASLPAARLSLGSLSELPGKGLRMVLPAGFTDAAPLIVGVSSGTSLGRLGLFVDRLATRMDLASIEQALLEGSAFGTSPWLPHTDRPLTWHRNRAVRTGLARMESEHERAWMVFAIADVGGEKIVARVVGPADDVAFNRGAIHAVLASIDASRLITAPLTSVLPATLAPRPMALPAPFAHVPAGTVVAEVGTAGCPGGQAPSGSLVALLERDFTVRFTATWWAPGVSLDRVAASCLGAETTRTSQRRGEYFGVMYASDTRLVTSIDGHVLMLSMAAPQRTLPWSSAAFQAWVDSVSIQTR